MRSIISNSSWQRLWRRRRYVLWLLRKMSKMAKARAMKMNLIRGSTKVGKRWSK